MVLPVNILFESFVLADEINEVLKSTHKFLEFLNEAPIVKILEEIFKIIDMRI